MAMASIVYDAALSAREDPFRRVSYSRRKAFYAAAARYHGTAYGYDTVVPAIDALVGAGLLIEHDKRPGGPIGSGIQSSFLPSPRLAEVMFPKAVCELGELIRLKDAKGNLIAYRDTERTSRDRKLLKAVNDHISSAGIRLEAGTLDGQMIRFANHAVYPDMTELYRVYNGGWTLGGRYYGGWWQQVSSGDREHFRIDGGASCEVDYEMLHPRLLYAAAGRKLAGDAYTIDGWDRKVCKRAFNILINANSYPRALGAIQPYVDGDREAAVRLVKALKRHHKPVAGYFHSGAGLRLQNVDSEIAKSVLQELTVRRGMTVLPIHDSFIVRDDHREDLLETMDRAYTTVISSVGIRNVISKGYRKITPHREKRRGGADGVPTIPLLEDVNTRAADTCLSEELGLPRALGVPDDDNRTDQPVDRVSASAPSPSVTNTASPDQSFENRKETPMTSEFNLTRASEEETQVLRQLAQSATCTDTQTDPILNTPDDQPRRMVSPPDFMRPDAKQKLETAALRRLADRPLTSGRTIDLIPRVRRREKSAQRI